MAIGDAADIILRIKRLIPTGWFAYVAPYRDAIFGGLADTAAWCYRLIVYAQAQSRLATAYGIWLDVFAYDFLGRFLTRSGAEDNTFRIIIRSTILQERVTRLGMIQAVTALTSKTPQIFEPWNTNDTGAYSSPAGSGGANYGSFGYNVGSGGYGNMLLPCQTFMKITRLAGAGVPKVFGYNGNIGGYGIGAIEWIGVSAETVGITDAMIYDLISKTKPTGCTCWVAFRPISSTLVSDSGALILTDEPGTSTLTTR